MALTEDSFIPNSPSTGSVGTAGDPWGEGHFTLLKLNGASVATLASPTFIGVPKAPTATAGTSTTQLATTAFATAAAADAKSRSNHNGTQLASTISDFAAAVAASGVGLAAHARNGDTLLAAGTASEVSAAALVEHLANASVHRTINDAGTSPTDLWSAEKILAELTAISEAGLPEITPDDITGLGALAVKDEVITALLADAAVTPIKLSGGIANPAASTYYGANAAATLGFHDLTAGLRLKSVPSDGYGTLALESGELVVVLGSTAKRAASGADTRFPTAGEKSALAGTGGTPGDTNRYVTEVGLTESIWPVADNVALFAATADETSLFALDLSAIATATQRNLIMPDADVNLGTGFLKPDASIAGAGWQEFLGINLTDATELTIAGGSITVVQSLHAVDTETDAATDDLDTIVAVKGAGDLLLLYPADAGRVTTLKHGTGNILTSTAADIELTGLTLLARVGANWLVGVMADGVGGVSLPVADTSALVRDPVDSTKQVRIDAGAVPTETTAAIQAPPGDCRIREMIPFEITGDGDPISTGTVYQSGWPGNFHLEGFLGSIVTQGTDATVTIQIKRNGTSCGTASLGTGWNAGSGYYGQNTSPSNAAWSTGDKVEIVVTADGSGSAGSPGEGLKVWAYGYWTLA